MYKNSFSFTQIAAFTAKLQHNININLPFFFGKQYLFLEASLLFIAAC